jgi:hypothetical protein
MFARLSSAVLAVGAVFFGLGGGLVDPGVAHAAGPAVIGGGSGIVIDGQSECTLTTIGRDAAGRLVGITAGHCGNAGARVVAEGDPSRGQIGRFVYSNHALDYAVIAFDPTRITPVSRVGGLAIHQIGAPSRFGQIVCKEGRTTANTCGVTWGPLFGTVNQTWTQLCVIEGDSGAPVVQGTTLVGMVNAYLGFACLGPEVGTNMDAVLRDLNARGIPGAGFRPI